MSEYHHEKFYVQNMHRTQIMKTFDVVSGLEFELRKGLEFARFLNTEGSFRCEFQGTQTGV